MTTAVIGVTFPESSQWHQDELDLISMIKMQIDQKFPSGNNLLVNTTWFGPQFSEEGYNEIYQYQNKVDRIFFLSSVDPVMLVPNQLAEIVKVVGAKESYYFGNFDSEHQFSFIATLLPKYFQKYTATELLMQRIDYIYITYNRKPRQHRTRLVNLLIEHNLEHDGFITLGNDDNGMYSQDEPLIKTFIPGETVDDYACEGNWGMDNKHGIPHDIHSLGNMDIWQGHFLNIVGETEFNPWDNMFITEKTWKPILGLRPFVINGQSKIYQYLRDNGFKTFNHLWPHIEVENALDTEVTDRIIDVIEYLKMIGSREIEKMYGAMIPDLLHNQKRFAQFAQEQDYKINSILL